MSTASIVSIVLALLQLVVKLMSSVEAEKLREDGRVAQINANLAALQKLTARVRDAETQVINMSDDDIANELRKYSGEQNP